MRSFIRIIGKYLSSNNAWVYSILTSTLAIDIYILKSSHKSSPQYYPHIK